MKVDLIRRKDSYTSKKTGALVETVGFYIVANGKEIKIKNAFEGNDGFLLYEMAEERPVAKQ